MRLGRYELGALLGEGGAGRVYDAVMWGPGGLRKPVALKVLRAGARALQREARLGGLLRHANLVDVFEVGEDEGVWFLALERCEGRLSDHMPLSPRAVVEVGQQVCQALRYAHEELGLVHLDLKPDNLLFGADGTVKVADLGIARADGFGEDGIRGTPGYMAPEQARGDDVDARADVYALGRTLVELATGHPRVAPSTFAWDGPLEEARSDETAPDWLAPVLARCLAPTPEDRYPDMTALAEALGQLNAGGTGLRQALKLAPLTPEDPLDAYHTAFVGRDMERAALAVALRQPGMVVLRGPAGVGKSRLATEVARTWRAEGGQAWRCDLVDAQSEEGLYFALARALELPLVGEPSEQLGAALAARGEVLLLLDNFGQLAAHRPVLDTWLARAPDLRLLVTSRRSLGVGPTELSLSPLPTADAVTLVLDRAAARGAVLEHNEALRELAERLEGLPLALELAAGRLGVLSVHDVLDRLDLDLLRSGGTDRHGTLTAALDWSWNLLGETERDALTQLSVFAGGFTLELAEQVVDIDDEVGAAVASLLDHSLVRPVGQARFELPMSVLAYARAKGPEPASELRHGSVFAMRGRRAALQALRTHGGVARMRSLSAELDNLVVACRRAIARADAPSAVLTLTAARRVLDDQGPHTAARRVTDEVFTLPLGDEWQARALLLRATSLHNEGRIDEGIALLRKARDGFEDRPWWRANVDVALGRAHRDLGRAEEAILAYDRAAANFELAGDPRGAADAQAGIGLLRLEQGELDRAGPILESARQVLQTAGDRRGVARASSSLGILHARRGHLEEARVALQGAVTAFREVGSRRDEAIVLSNLANLSADVGAHEQARAAYAAALAIHREVGNRRFEGIVLANWASLLHATNELEEAVRIGEQALAVNRSVGDRRVEGAVLGTLGAVLEQQGDAEQARTHLETALELSREVGDRSFEAYWLGQLARLAVAEPTRAHALLDEAETIAQTMGATPDLVELWAIRVEVLAAQGRHEQAAALWRDASDAAPEDHADLQRTLERARQCLATSPRGPGGARR